MVQLEIRIQDDWEPVIRYDCAHGFAHVDKYDPYRLARKVPLDLDYKSALNLAEWDIGSNWEKYIIEYKRKIK